MPSTQPPMNANRTRALARTQPSALTAVAEQSLLKSHPPSRAAQKKTQQIADETHAHGARQYAVTLLHTHARVEISKAHIHVNQCYAATVGDLNRRAAQPHDPTTRHDIQEFNKIQKQVYARHLLEGVDLLADRLYQIAGEPIGEAPEPGLLTRLARALG